VLPLYEPTVQGTCSRGRCDYEPIAPGFPKRIKGDNVIMENELQKCPIPLKPTDAHIRDCLREQQQATAHVLAHVKQKVDERKNDPPFLGTRSEIARQRKRLEKAFELFKQAEAHLHILIAGPGGDL
jgi:hypothetical protein